MKKIIYFIGIALLVFASCESLEDVYKERDAQQTGYVNSVEQVLTTEDYEAIAEIAYNSATTPTDSAFAAFIEAYEHFNDTVKAADYIPPYLAQLYPALSFKSSALVTYNYNGEMPEDFTMYTDANFYNLVDEDYASFDSILNIIKFYTPAYDPEVYIPGVLNEVVAAPEDGDIMLVGYEYATANPTIDFKQIGEIAIYSEGFTNEADGLGSYTDHSIIGDQGWGWNKYGNGNAKISGFASGSSNENENWLVSPEYDLANLEEVSLSFMHAVNYNDGAWDNMSVQISTNYDGSSSPTTATWAELAIPNVPFTESWDFVESGSIDLSSYVDQKVYIAFKYLSTTSIAGTWEISEISISIPGVPITGKAPEYYKNYYTYTEGMGWAKTENTHFVNAVDYDAMGAPGKYNNFSSSAKPMDYLPSLLSSKYPLAGEGVEIATVYKYYNSASGSASMLADMYTYTNGVWESSYNFVEPKTDQFLVTNENNWVFDPTITIAMVSEDYQLVVDWVKANKGDDFIDSFGTQEFYTGAGAYYGNYDIREGKFEADDFATWEEALIYSVGSIFLPIKFPNAQTQVDGIDMFYIVNFDTYSGADGNYSIKFQVTKSGPNPEFTWIEGPY